MYGHEPRATLLASPLLSSPLLASPLLIPLLTSRLGTGKLVATISGLRKQNEPHRQETKRVREALEKIAIDMVTQKAGCHKALDERERCLDQFRHLQEDSARDAHDFVVSVEQLRREAEDLDARARRAEHVLADATEHTLRTQVASRP